MKKYIVVLKPGASLGDAERLDQNLRLLFGENAMWITTDLVIDIHEVTDEKEES